MSGVVKSVKKVIHKVIPKEIREPISSITRPIDQTIRSMGGYLGPLAMAANYIPGVGPIVGQVAGALGGLTGGGGGGYMTQGYGGGSNYPGGMNPLLGGGLAALLAYKGGKELPQAASEARRIYEGATGSAIDAWKQATGQAVGELGGYGERGVGALDQAYGRAYGSQAPWARTGYGAEKALYGEAGRSFGLPEFSDEQFRIQREEGLADIDQALAARGLASGGRGTLARTDYLRNLYAGRGRERYGQAMEEAKFRGGILSDIASRGAGAAGNIAAAALGAGGNIASLLGNVGQNISNAYLQGGQGQAYSNLFGAQGAAGAELQKGLGYYDKYAGINQALQGMLGNQAFVNQMGGGGGYRPQPYNMMGIPATLGNLGQAYMGRPTGPYISPSAHELTKRRIAADLYQAPV